MNFLSMEYFMAVAARRNITKAANDLYITQQTLSAHIAAIEKELACQLLVRSNPLELTYAGETFLRHATNIYESYQSMWNEFNDLTHNQRGKLLVGIDYIRSRTFMPKMISAFQSAYPYIEVRLLEGVNKSLQQSLVNKDIDLAIARFPEPIPGVEILDFYNEEVIMLAAAQLVGESSPKDGIYLDDLTEFSGYPFILGNAHDVAGQIGREMLRKSGFQPIIKAQSSNIETLLALCVKGIGICFCPNSSLQSVLTVDQLRQMQIYHFNTATIYPIHFAYRKTSYQWKIVSEFIRITQEQKNIFSLM